MMCELFKSIASEMFLYYTKLVLATRSLIRAFFCPVELKATGSTVEFVESGLTSDVINDQD